jgi:hypothetical protein
MFDSHKNAYFAGLIDGEGTINVYPYKSGKYMRPVVKLNMTCLATVTAVHDYFGGSLLKKKVKEGFKPQWHWIVTFNKAIDVVEQIRPYLITKAKEADLVLAAPRGRQGVKRSEQKPQSTALG